MSENQQSQQAVPENSPVTIKQLVRTIGQADSPETQNVVGVNKELEKLLAQGWEFKTVRPLGMVPGGVQVYYLLVKPG